MMLIYNLSFTRLPFIVLLLISWQTVSSQTTVLQADLSFFKNPGNNWKMAGDVSADPFQNSGLQLSNGTGILVNVKDKKNAGTDLLSNLQLGDIDLEMDYLLPKGSKSGIYLQGRYEILLMDSWKEKHAGFNENGGINERWDESKPQEQKGFEGHSPRQNISRAPGLWQHLRLSFQAPGFDSTGHKTQNAKIISAELNGVVIHEDLELKGPTRGSTFSEEAATGPLRLLGDQGEIAFKNIRITNYGKPPPRLTNLQYEVYKGKFEKEPDYKNLPPEAKGTATSLSSTVNKIPNEFLLRFTGMLQISEPGEYTLNVSAPGGRGYLKVNNQVVLPYGEMDARKVNLPAGNLPFEILYAKFVSYARPVLGLRVSGPGIREFLMSEEIITPSDQVDPILVQASVNTILRCFIDLPGDIRIMHGVNVGSPEKVHYTYDLDNAMIVQLWRGDFLDATPMWVGRGDGSSRALGSLLYFGQPQLTIARLTSPQAAWITDTAGAGFRVKGYFVDKSNLPTFRYQVYGTTINDAVRVLEGADGVRREITVQDATGDLYVRLASDKKIQRLSNGLYSIGDHAYYMRIEEVDGVQPIIRDVKEGKEIILPLKNKVIYSVIF